MADQPATGVPGLGRAAYEAEGEWLAEIMPGGRSPSWDGLDPEHREVYERIAAAVRDRLVAEQPREGEQPLPVPNDGPSMHDLVIGDLGACGVSWAENDAAAALLRERKQTGLDRYGSILQSHNGRDWLRDLREEVADAAVYARQGVEELRGHAAQSDAYDAYEAVLAALFKVLAVPGAGNA